MVLQASLPTDHFYLDSGHVIDSINKAFELLDRIDWEEAGDVLSSLVNQLCQAQRSEETNAWRTPVDLKQLLLPSLASLEQRLADATGQPWRRPEGFIDTLLDEDPQAIIATLDAAVEAGATPLQLAGEVAYAAALRIYLDRFLNIPAARLPTGTGSVEGDGPQALADYLDLLNRQQQVDEAGRRVYDYVAAGHDVGALYGALAESLVREDAEFHSYQMLEAEIRQYEERSDPEEQRLILVAAARYLAAHAPT